VETLTPAHTRPAAEAVGRAQATFRVALDAMSHPGRAYRLPAGAVDAPGNPWATALLLTLLDHETTLWVAPAPGDAGAAAPLATYLRQRTGARLVALEDAGFALADTAGLAPGALADVLRRLRPGTLAYPDEGATLVLTVPRLEAVEADGDARAQAADGLTLCCSGPGVPAGVRRRLRLVGAGAELVAAREAAAGEYPAGIDLILVDGAGRMAGLPRSTRLETLETRAAVEAQDDGL
jgi:alpha-D-ribose 1-methylphosphonate 5-triphosphate synthase subunit PhnH